MFDSNNTDLKIKRKIAAAEDTSVEMLQQLSKDSDREVRSLVAGNPNTPQDILLELSNEFAEVVTDNPIFDLLMLENPSSYFVRISLARSSTTAIATFEKLIQDSNYGVRSQSVATILDTPRIDAFEILANASEKTIRQQVACNLKTPLHLLNKLASDPLYPVRELVAENPNTPTKILETLASDRGQMVRRSIAQNSNISSQLLARIAKDKDEDVRGGVAHNSHVSLEILKKLASDESWRTRQAVAESYQIPIEILKMLASDENRSVRQAVAENSQTPLKLLKTLISDENWYVCEAAKKTLKDFR
jgi:hypothetical protein